MSHGHAKKKSKKNGNGKVGGKADVHVNTDGSRNKSLLGYNSIFTPEVIDDIHIKAQLGRYRTVSYTHLTLPTKA